MRVREVRNSRRRGSVIVETSLIMMLFLMIVFGIADFGFVLFQHQTLMHRTRSAARYGVIHPTDLTAIQNIVLYGQPSLPAGKSTGDPGMFGIVPSMVDVSRAGTGDPEDRIRITLSGYRYTFVAPLIAGRFTGKPIRVSLPVEGS
jgi:TadE-like protein